MGKIEKFEELEIWKIAISSDEIYFVALSPIPGLLLVTI
jgi:hypothetical protein